MKTSSELSGLRFVRRVVFFLVWGGGCRPPPFLSSILLGWIQMVWKKFLCTRSIAICSRHSFWSPQDILDASWRRSASPTARGSPSSLSTPPSERSLLSSNLHFEERPFEESDMSSIPKPKVFNESPPSETGWYSASGFWFVAFDEVGCVANGTKLFIIFSNRLQDLRLVLIQHALS